MKRSLLLVLSALMTVEADVPSRGDAPHHLDGTYDEIRKAAEASWVAESGSPHVRAVLLDVEPPSLRAPLLELMHQTYVLGYGRGALAACGKKEAGK